jgi:two-component system, response regulator PdtaR
MKLLLVEDHLLVAQAMGLYLTEAGHEIVGIAADAHEAVELAGNMLPDLALVDVQLAYGTSGIDAARDMLAQHNVRSLFVTSDYDAARAANDAAVGCVRKPYPASELIAAIRAAENCLKIDKLTPCSLRLEFYKGSLERGHLHEAAAGRDCSTRAVPATAPGASTIGLRQARRSLPAS